jgi:hypothetical protein
MINMILHCIQWTHGAGIKTCLNVTEQTWQAVKVLHWTVVAAMVHVIDSAV